MLIRAIAFLLIAASLAQAQDASLRYATFNDQATAQALSASAWAAVQCQPQPSCDAAQVTKYNYPVIGLTNGKYAIVIHSGDVFQGEHLSLPSGRTFDLTANQIAALQTRAQMNTLLGDILSVALVGSRITAGQMTAINAYANTHPTFKANYTLLTSGPIDLEGALVWSVLAELQAAGILAAADVQTITQPQATAVVTQNLSQ